MARLFKRCSYTPETWHYNLIGIEEISFYRHCKSFFFLMQWQQESELRKECMNDSGHMDECCFKDFKKDKERLLWCCVERVCYAPSLGCRSFSSSTRMACHWPATSLSPDSAKLYKSDMHARGWCRLWTTRRLQQRNISQNICLHQTVRRIQQLFTKQTNR